MAKGAKTSKTYRLPGYTIDKITDLATYFNESGAEAVERAVNLLDRERANESRREHEERVGKIKTE